jgi:hypothetical protein
MIGKPAKAAVWLVTYTHKAGEERGRHRELFLTSDPTGGGLYEVVREAVPAACREDLIIVSAERHGDASGVVTLREPVN